MTAAINMNLAPSPAMWSGSSTPAVGGDGPTVDSDIVTVDSDLVTSDET